ncbi:hypothetical protein B0J17DRAFT_630671 [Rhizoctonia solani]|nr:hypothetical protein B0J17DRAFT_630671 [Rhizoctonia solani]
MAAARGEIAPTGAGEANFDSTINPNLEESSTDKCQRIIRLLYELNLSFGEFSVAVCYGDPLLRSDIDCISARKSLYQTKCFEQLLENSYHPPLPPSGGGRRPVAGGKILDSFAQEVIKRKFAKELKAFSEDTEKMPISVYYAMQSDRYDIPEEPKNTGEGEDEDDDKDIGTPGLKAPPKKDPYFYLHAGPASEQVCILPTSAGWDCYELQLTRHAIQVLDEDMRILLEKIAKHGPLLMVHNNIRLEEPVASQCGDNQSVTDNGTAITVIHLPPSALALENCKLSSIDWKADCLKHPIGPKQLPYGPEHCVKQHMVPVVNINESTYSGNSQVVLMQSKRLAFIL